MKKFMLFCLLAMTLVLVGCIRRAEAQTNSSTDDNAQTVQPQGQSPANIELWNGFTTGMTGDEALGHARIIFGAMREDARKIGCSARRISYLNFFGLFEVIPTQYASNDYWSLIIPDELEPSTIEFGTNSDYGRITLFFLKDSLWAMSINYYNFTTADMQKALTERYGTYRERANIGNHFWWTTSGKHIILFAESFNIIDGRQLQGILRKIDEIAEERQSKIQL